MCLLVSVSMRSKSHKQISQVYRTKLTGYAEVYLVDTVRPKKNMCVSDHMGPHNRVGRSGFFFAIFFYCPKSEILDKF